MNQVSYDNSHASLSYIYILPIAPSDSVQNVMISNVTNVDDIAVSITWDPPTDPNGVIRYYRVVFQQTSEMSYGIASGSGSGTDNSGCPPINTTIMEERVLRNGTTEVTTMITLRGLG